LMPGQRVYMGGLSYRAGDRDVEHFFRKYGRLKEISLKNGYAFIEFEDPRDAEDAVYDLHGVDFMGERVTVELAKGTPHGRDKERWGHPPRGDRDRDRSWSRDRDRGRGWGPDRYRGERPSWLDKYGPPTRTDYRVTVENLSSKVSWQDLKDFMRTAGEVTFADAHKTRKNEGTVEFATREDMEAAIDKLDDTELDGRRIRLVAENSGGSRSPMVVRSRGGRRPRSRSRSRSRSRLRSRSRSNGRRSRSRSRSRSRRKSRSRSRSDRKSRSRSRRSRSRSKSRSRRKSRSDSGKSASRSRSRSMKTRSRSKGETSPSAKKDSS